MSNQESEQRHPRWRYRPATTGGFLVFMGGEYSPPPNAPLFHVPTEDEATATCNYLNALEADLTELRELVEEAALTYRELVEEPWSVKQDDRVWLSRYEDSKRRQEQG